MIKEILDNDFYIGTFRLKKRARNTVHGKDKRVPKEEQCIFENHHPAIIDKATFALVQELKEKRNRTNIGEAGGSGLAQRFRILLAVACSVKTVAAALHQLNAKLPARNGNITSVPLITPKADVIAPRHI